MIRRASSSALALDVVGQLLRRQQRALQALFLLAVSADDAFQPRQFLAQAIGLAQRLLVVVGDGHQKRRHLDLVEAAEGVAETLLPEIQWTDIHGA